MRVVAGDKIDARLHQAGDKMDIARQPVELGDDEGRAAQPASGEGRGHLRAPALVGAGFDLAKFGDERALRGGYMAGDSLALGLGAERLAAGRYADIGNEPRRATRAYAPPRRPQRHSKAVSL